jgi:hypothetical protein
LKTHRTAASLTQLAIQSQDSSDADMEMIYDSDAFCVMRIELPATAGGARAQPLADEAPMLQRGGYEIVDKLSRKEIFIEGAMAASFQDDVQALIETQPTMEEIDEYLGRFSSLMQQPVVAH